MLPKYRPQYLILYLLVLIITLKASLKSNVQKPTGLQLPILNRPVTAGLYGVAGQKNQG